MPSLTKLVSAVRVGVVILAAGVTLLTVLYIVSIPPPPPESDGFAHGMAAMIGGGIILVSLGLATITIITPTLMGRADPLGFNRWQRRALQAASGLVGLGVVLAFLAGIEGLFLLVTLFLLSFVIVCATLIWRFGEVIADRRMMTGVAE